MALPVTSQRMLAGIVLLAAVSVTACAAHPAGNVAGPPRSPADTGAASPRATPAASTSAAAPTATPTGSTGIQNLVISNAALSQLTQAFVAYEGIPLSDVLDASPMPGTVFYAYDPTTDTYWALAHFAPSLTAPTSVQEQLEDGATSAQAIAMFREDGAAPWQVQLAPANTVICSYAQFFPPAVSTAWALPTTPPGGGTC